ncbi:MAG: SRPBCC family protein [Candidatus Marinimicrobia bacterium]|nr:SRPBCC family protein [Candidatus Neomarinimicrobiota bacterium]
MPKIETKLTINAPIELAFDLSRSIDFHAYTQTLRSEKAVGGVTKGLIELNQTVTWRARHFGISQYLTARISEFDRPFHFRDTMEKGAFKRFDHDHFFEIDGDMTIMTDIFDYDTPFSIFGKIFDKLVLYNYMSMFFKNRNNIIKEALESGAWKDYLK